MFCAFYVGLYTQIFLHNTTRMMSLQKHQHYPLSWHPNRAQVWTWHTWTLEFEKRTTVLRVSDSSVFLAQATVMFALCLSTPFSLSSFDTLQVQINPFPSPMFLKQRSPPATGHCLVSTAPNHFVWNVSSDSNVRAGTATQRAFVQAPDGTVVSSERETCRGHGSVNAWFRFWFWFWISSYLRSRWAGHSWKALFSSVSL